MKIIIATGIYPPEAGGPATYCVGLEKALRDKGHTVEVVLYGVLKIFPTGIRHILYTCKLFCRVLGADAIIALDTFSVGVPAVFVARLLGKKIIVRAGGDFLWEQYLNTGGEILLSDFYTSGKIFTWKEKIIFALTRFVMRNSIVVFNTEYQKNIWIPAYKIEPTHTYVSMNAIEEPLEALAPKRKNFVFHVRDIPMKNIARVRQAIAQAQKIDPTIILEDGIVPHDVSMRATSECYAVLAPSLCDISPNYVMEALRYHKPFILTKHSGIAEWLAPYGTIVDPLDVDDITRAILHLATKEGYADACERVAKFSYVRTYSDIANELLEII